jgi:prepilin-type N-terminal cleavage/methylation domain-containing protein
MRTITKRSSSRRGFTLIELLAVILIIGILMTFLLPQIPAAIDNARVLACRKNMEEIYKGLMSYDSKYDDLPQEEGVRFFASLISRGVWENTEASGKKLTCPGVKVSSLALRDIAPEDWFTDLETVTGEYSSYAGRDTKNHPLRKFPGSGKEPLVADDNDPEMNHDTTTCVLFADGNVGTFELFEEREKGTIAEDEEVLIVGPDSPIEVLQKLSID